MDDDGRGGFVRARGVEHDRPSRVARSRGAAAASSGIGAAAGDVPAEQHPGLLRAEWRGGAGRAPCLRALKEPTSG